MSEQARTYAQLLQENERLRSLLARVPVVDPCEINPGPPRCGDCEACRDLKQLDREVEAWDRDTERGF